MRFPYGAQYYRTPGPPREDWERDHRQMREHGFNFVKHYVMWNIVHLSEDAFDFTEIDGLLDVAERHDIQVVLQITLEGVGGPPHWIWQRYPHAWLMAHDGSRRYPRSAGHSVTGSAPGICLDNEKVRVHADAFVAALARRYRDHRALWGYDVWNEAHSREDPPGPSSLYYCYCEGTCAQFRLWLRQKYLSLHALEQAWYQRFQTWDEILPPRSRGAYPDCFDWQEFKLQDRLRLLRERVRVLRSEDPVHPMISHGIAGTSRRLYDYMGDEWSFAKEVDEWGLTVAPGRRDNDHRNFFQMVDLVRCAARGKPIWLGEFQGGHLWLWEELEGRPLSDARYTYPEDVRVWNWIGLMTGLNGILYWRWRPEMLGPLTDWFGLCERDGASTERLDMAGGFARLTNEHPDIMAAQLPQGEVGILILHEAQRFANVAYPRLFHAWADAVRGVYKAFLDHNIQADFIEVEDLDDYALVYLPYPLMIARENAARLKEYVQRGGRLVCEAGAASYVDGGNASPRVPGLGLDELFGAGATSAEVVQLMPDLLQELRFEIGGTAVRGRVGIERIAPQGGRAIGRFDDGSVAAVENDYGEGKTIYVGTYPSIAYLETEDASASAWIAGLLAWAGRQQRITTNHPGTLARTRQGQSGTYLFVLNTARDDARAVITLSDGLPSFQSATDIQTGRLFEIEKGTLRMLLPARDGAVLTLGPAPTRAD